VLKPSRQLSPFWLLLILTGLNLLNYVDRFVLNAVRTPMAESFHVNYGTSGRMFTFFMLGYFITSPFFGYLGDRISRKWLIAVGIFVWSVGTVLTGVAGSFSVLLFYRVLVGFGEASYATISPGLISDAFSATKRNNALTIFYAALPVGAALGYLIGGEIAAVSSWRHAFIWAGAPGLLLALVLLPFADPPRGQAELPPGQTLAKPQLRDYLALIKNGRYQLLIWGYVAYTFALGAFSFWGPTFLETVHHLPAPKPARFFGGVIVFGGLIGTLLGGFAASAWQKRTPAGYAWLLALSTLLAVPTAFAALRASTAGGAMAFLAVTIFLLFLSTGPVNTLILESAPPNIRASAMALSIFMIHLFGDLGSPEIVGHLSDAFHDLQKGVLLLPVMLLLGGLLWLALALKIGRRSRENV
jgi:MFS family permease